MQQVEFNVKNLTLKGTLFFPKKLRDKNPAILFVHGWTSERIRSFQYAKSLAKLGYVSLVFDMKGHGDSEGDRNNFSPKDFMKDCKVAYDYLLQVKGVDKENISLVGNSFGAYLGVILTSKRKIKNIVLRAPGNYPNDVFEKSKHLFSGSTNTSIREWRKKLLNPDEAFALQAASQFVGEVLIIESENDESIAHETIVNYMNAVSDISKVTHIVMKNAPHSISEGPFRDMVEQILNNWFGDFFMKWKTEALPKYKKIKAKNLISIIRKDRER
ncbi:MAG: alpha/beta fold hydrolase [bacterium]|nr:alpha/beta fold hydrolase [bacterium]